MEPHDRFFRVLEVRSGDRLNVLVGVGATALDVTVRAFLWQADNSAVGADVAAGDCLNAGGGN